MASVLKKVNHNAILIEDDGIEKIIMRKGIGFQTALNKAFDIEPIDKVY